MKRETQETLIWIFCLLVVILLSVRMIVESGNYNCEECTVTFTNTIASGEVDYEFGEFKIKELFEDLTQNDHCAVVWDSTQGYQYGE